MTLAPFTMPTPASLADRIARLRQKDADLGSPDDVVRSTRAETEFYGAKQRIAQTIGGLMNHGLDAPTAKLRELERRRDIVIAAQASFEQQLKDAPDWRSLPTREERDKEWGRQEAIKASVRAIHCGVEYFGGVPSVPHPLAVALGGFTTDAEGRTISPWFGSLPTLDRQIAELTARVVELRAELTAHLANADALLGEMVATTG